MAAQGWLVPDRAHSLHGDGCINVSPALGRFHCNSLLFEKETFAPQAPSATGLGHRDAFQLFFHLLVSIAIFTRWLFFTS